MVCIAGCLRGDAGHSRNDAGPDTQTAGGKGPDDGILMTHALILAFDSGIRPIPGCDEYPDKYPDSSVPSRT
jgi:hypothetical protein